MGVAVDGLKSQFRMNNKIFTPLYPCFGVKTRDSSIIIENSRSFHLYLDDNDIDVFKNYSICNEIFSILINNNKSISPYLENQIKKYYLLYASNCYKPYKTRIGVPIYIDISTGINIYLLLT